MVAAEWQALKLEHQAESQTGKDAIETLRLAAEYRRQLLLHDRDLDRAKTPAAATAPVPPAKSLAQHFAEKAAARHAAK